MDQIARRFAVLLLAPVALSAQPSAQLGSIESRVAHADTVNPRKPAGFARRIPAAPVVRLGRLRQEEIDAVARDPRLTLRGIERQLGAPGAPQRGQWQSLDDGRTVWRVTIQADGAIGLRVLFTRFAVGTGEVWVYSGDGTQVFGPYAGDGIDGTGTFWSNTVFGDALTVEYQPASLPDDGLYPAVPFAIPRVSHMTAWDDAMAAGSCELDVSCYPSWSAVANGVGMYLFQSGGASYACSGALVNNTAKDFKPYFLTAGHCISDPAAASSVEVFWNFQTSQCNGAAPNPGTLPRTLGASYLAGASIESGDYSLLKLSPLPNINLTFFGWNASATAAPVGTSLTGIHHPEADYTRIIFGSRTADAPAQVGSDLAPAADYYQVQATSGRIEPGSSGSPLFTSDQSIVGTLTYGPTTPACSTSPFTAGYARFSVAYPALSTYLSPSNTSSGSGSSDPPPAAVTVTASPNWISLAYTTGGVTPAASTIAVSTNSTSALALTLKASQSWIVLSPSSLAVSAGRSASFAVTLNTQAFTAVGTYSGTITISGTGVSQSVGVQATVTAPAAAVKGGPISVIPFWQDGGGVATTFQLLNPYSTPTTASVSFVANNGTPLPVTAAGVTASWQTVTIPAYNSATISTAGTSSPLKTGFALVQSSDPTKRVQAYAQIGQDVVNSSASLAAPLAIPFDATSSATTTLYLYNPASSGTLTLGLAIYDSTGTEIGAGDVTVPAGQEGAIPISQTAAIFGGKKGTLYLSGSGTVLGLALRAGSDGRLGTLVPW